MHVSARAHRRFNRLGVLGCGLMLWLAASGSAVAQSNTPPVVSIQPANGFAGVGEDFAFNAQVTGTAPFIYQWLFNSSPLSGATNASLVLTNLTTSQLGLYSVTVGNVAATNTSANATLTVTPTLPRRLGTGRILQVGPQVGVPITFRANGRESAVSFSLSYDTNAYANPVFLPASGLLVVSNDLTQPATIGLALTNAAGLNLPAGYQWVGLLQFDLAPGAGALQGGLAFATNPVPIAAFNTNGLALMISAGVQPQYLLATTKPALNPQSGLFQQQLFIGNPSATTMTNLDILALNLGAAIQTNADGTVVTNPISCYNADATNLPVTLTDYPFGDPLVQADCGDCGTTPTNLPSDFVSYLACGSAGCALDFTSATNPALPFAQINNLLPGTSNTVTLEFYVTDHRTVPTPVYSLYLSDPLLRAPPAYFVVPVTLVGSRFTNGTYLVEFNTQPGLSYYVQYADTMSNLTANPLTALPAIGGTGGRVQWIDNGPPKTLSAPTNAERFYRVLTSQGQ